MIKRGEAPEGYKKTKLGIIPNDWDVIRIKECLERVDNPVTVETEKKYMQIGIRSHGKGLFYKEEVTGKELGNKKVFWIEPNCFIVNIVFAWEQAVGKTTEDEIGMIASHRFPMYRPINDKVSVDYLVQYFMTEKGKEVMEYASPGGAGRNRTLGQDRFMKSYIVCPEHNEQKRIAEVMSYFDKLIFGKEKFVQEKRKQRTWLIHNLLTGKKRISGSRAKWEITSLYKIANVIEKKNKINNTNVLTISAKLGLINQKDFFKKEIASENKENYYLIEKNDFAYNKSYSSDYAYGATKRLKNYEIGIVSPLYICFHVFNKKVFLDYLEYYFESGLLNRQIRSIAQEGARNHGLLNISKKDYFKLKIALPDYEEQVAIAKVLTTADKEIELLEKQLEQIKLEKKAMMQLLLSGIVRVDKM